jgi:hypothetical protein
MWIIQARSIGETGGTSVAQATMILIHGPLGGAFAARKQSQK